MDMGRQYIRLSWRQYIFRSLSTDSVPNLNNVIQISGGGSGQAFALKEDGSLGLGEILMAS